MAQAPAVIMSLAGAVMSAPMTITRTLLTAPGSAEMASPRKHGIAKALKNISPNATFNAGQGLILEKYVYLSSRNKIIHPQNCNGKT